MAAKLTLTVSQLNEYIRRMLQLDPMLHGVALRGEISNLKFHQSGTIFFTLKDELSAIACVMYASDTANLQVTPFEGMRAVVSGSAGLYVRGGQMQFYANDLRAEGVGVLYERLLALKDRLAKEGDIVTLSPASASFDLYRNFEERGDHFKRLVQELPE